MLWSAAMPSQYGSRWIPTNRAALRERRVLQPDAPHVGGADFDVRVGDRVPDAMHVRDDVAGGQFAAQHRFVADDDAVDRRPDCRGSLRSRARVRLRSADGRRSARCRASPSGRTPWRRTALGRGRGRPNRYGSRFVNVDSCFMSPRMTDFGHRFVEALLGRTNRSGCTKCRRAFRTSPGRPTDDRKRPRRLRNPNTLRGAQSGFSFDFGGFYALISDRGHELR